MKIVPKLYYLLNQRIPVLILALFFAVVLFNTTYLNLGTTIPLAIIFLGLLVFSAQKRTKVNNTNLYFIGLAILIFFSTLLSGGEQFRECLKIFATAFFLYLATSMKLRDNEIQYFSLFICVSYLVYSILVIRAIGQDTAYYGRAQIRILNSDIALDPNVVATVFVLPMVISLYNLLYGKYKIIAGIFLTIFTIAIVASGSRGATVSAVVAIGFLLLKYFISRTTKTWVKFFSVMTIIVVAIVVFNFISEQDSVSGFDRVFDYSGDDASNGRTDIWKERLELFTLSPLWGYGTNYDMGSAHRGWACHNTYIQVLHYGGLIGTMLFFIPIVSLFKRTTVSKMTKLALFISVFMPVFFIDTLQERTIWNFLIFYSLLSMRPNAEMCLLWNLEK